MVVMNECSVTPLCLQYYVHTIYCDDIALVTIVYVQFSLYMNTSAKRAFMNKACI